MKCAALVLAILASAAPATAQQLAARSPMPSAIVPLDAAPSPVTSFEQPPIASDGPYVLIRLDQNRLYLMEGSRAVWDAPVATGTGFRLAGSGQRWDFATPRGVFRVKRRERDPVWIMPDWAFVEAGLPVPPADSPSRRRPGALGTSAIYIQHDLAIHGTDRPDLVLRDDPDARRISHGCIRMTNEDARTLYHLVEVGTPVLIY